MPSHYQRMFFEELNNLGTDFIVFYISVNSADRLKQGWNRELIYRKYEFVIHDLDSALRKCEDWQQRIHVLPGWGSFFLLKLIRLLSIRGIPWINWSEPSGKSMRRIFTWPVKKWYAEKVNHSALGTLAIGMHAVKYFEKIGIKSDKIAFLPYSVSIPTDKILPDSQILAFKGTNRIFMYAGQLSRRKGTDILLRAFERVSKGHDRWKLVLVGYDNSRGKYRAMAEKLGIGEKIFFRGVISSESIYSAMTLSDVFRLPSRWDGWGVVLSEALSCGLPLIGTKTTGSSWHCIDPGINGFRIDSSIGSLCGAMNNYFKDETLLDRHRQASLKLRELNSAAFNAGRFIEIMNAWK